MKAIFLALITLCLIPSCEVDRVQVALRADVARYNKQLPIEIAPQIFINKLEVSEDRMIIVYASIANADASQTNALQLRRQIKPELQKYYDTDPQMAQARELKVPVKYFLADKNGNPITDIQVKSSQ